MKAKAFWFHYNKPLSKQRNKNILTVHYDGQCNFVEDIVCQVPIKTRHRKTQPHCVLYGRGILTIEDGKATIRDV